jgi:hypothetical protein
VEERRSLATAGPAARLVPRHAGHHCERTARGDQELVCAHEGDPLGLRLPDATRGGEADSHLHRLPLRPPPARARRQGGWHARFLSGVQLVLNCAASANLTVRIGCVTVVSTVVFLLVLVGQRAEQHACHHLSQSDRLSQHAPERVVQLAPRRSVPERQRKAALLQRAGHDHAPDQRLVRQQTPTTQAQTAAPRAPGKKWRNRRSKRWRREKRWWLWQW